MKKNKIKQRNTYTQETEVGMNYVKVIVILLSIFLIFYIITYFVTKEKKATEAEPTIQYTEVIAGNILSLSSDEYYILVEMENDKYNGLYETYLQTYSSNEESLPYYKVDMSKGFNKMYISDESNLETTIPSELKFSATTFLKVKSGKIIEKYETNETIVSAMDKIVK